MLKAFRLPSITMALGATLLALAAVPLVRADGPDNNRTRVTFSGPVDIGATALPAGTYVFRSLESDRNLVQIMNSDETHLVALVRAVSAQAATPSSHTVIETREGAAGSPEMVHEWFYPGDTIGWEFLPATRKPALRPGD